MVGYNFNLEDALRVAAKLDPSPPKDMRGIDSISKWLCGENRDNSMKYPEPTSHDVINGLQKASLVCRMGRVVVTRDMEQIRMCSIPEVLSWTESSPDAKVEVQTVRMCTLRVSETMGADILLDDPRIAATIMVDSVMRYVARVVDDGAFLGGGEDGTPLGILKTHEEKKKEWGGHEVTIDAVRGLISRLSLRYQNDAAFFVGSDVYTKLMMLRDRYGMSLVTNDISGQKIYGFPIHVVPALSKAMVFGSMKDGITVCISPRIEAYKRSDLMWRSDLLRVDSHVRMAIHIVPDAFAVYYLYDNIVVRTVELVKEKVKRRVRQVKDRLTVAALARFIRSLPDTVKALPGRLKDFLCRRRDKDKDEYEDEGEEDI